jgi:LacI family transcriptional regulator
VLLPDLHGEFFSGVIRGLDVTARREGFHLLVSSSHSDTEELAGALRSMRGRIDGLVVMAPDVDTPSTIRGWAGDVPIVLIDPRGAFEEYHSVSIANLEGAQAMVQHLLSLGHRRIATVTGPERNVDARQRLTGYRAALREAGAERARELEIAGDFTEPSGYEAVRALLALEPRPTAVFVANDHMAVGVLRALTETGVRVPSDIAVAGFDDIETARYLVPPLTTVRVDRFELGARALQMLLKVVRAADGRIPYEHDVLTTNLVIRQSCGSSHAPPARARRNRDARAEERQ